MSPRKEQIKTSSRTPQREERRNSPDDDDDDVHHHDDDEAHPPFLPLEETNEINDHSHHHHTASSRSYCKSLPSGKKVVSTFMMAFIAVIVWDAMWTPTEQRWIRPDFSDNFLRWVQLHPAKGLLAFLIVIAVGVIFMIPIGTPLTCGCGYIYKGAYGWKAGLTIATAVSMGGSALGAVICFLLGRYLMRDQVRQWIRKYPLFTAIDVGKKHTSVFCTL